jgi:hypothetical protein
MMDDVVSGGRAGWWLYHCFVFGGGADDVTAQATLAGFLD